MNLFDLISARKVISEGGNLSSQSPGWQGMPGEHEAEEIDLKIHDRDFMVGKIRELLQAQNESFAAAYGKPIWDQKLLDSNKMFSGSSLHFFDVKGISTQDFLNKLKKSKVGDIDTQVNQDIGEEITAWLKSIVGKQVGNGTFVGFNSSLSALWLLNDPPVKIQVDYELGPYQSAQGKEPARPSEWFAYSHSSDYDDMTVGIKGVFHKYINRALTHAQSSTKYVARILKKSVKISPEPVTDSDYSFAVSSAQGGGLSAKYKPYVDPETGQPMEIDGVSVMQLIDPSQRDYVQNLDQQFQQFYGRKRTTKDTKLQNSFVGTMQLMNSTFSPEQNEAVARSFLSICFSQGAQMIAASDPVRDRDTKFAAIDYMIENLKLPDAQGLRKEAVQMALDYEAAFKNKQAGKAPIAENFADGRNPQDKGDSKRHGINTKASVSSLRNTAKQGGRKGQLAHWLANMKSGKAKHESLNEAEVKAQLRKGMPHLKDLKAADFLDLLDEIHDGNGNFKLENMPLNVKVDGFGGRFGKNADGKPFMGTSRTEPRYTPGFVKYHQEKGTQDPEILGRAKLFDDLFVEMMNAVKLVDSKLGPNFLVDKQVSCEVLFLPFATETPEGKLKFVGIHYDKLPQGVQLALVPLNVVTASTGEPVENSQGVIKELTGLGQQGSVMFIDNSLTQNEALDVTAIVPPLENIEELKSIVSDTMGKRDRASLELKKNVEAQLQPVKLALEKAIAEDPNIVGKDMLGKDYEGIVLNTRLGPVKITSTEQRAVIADKQASQASARAERPRGQAKTAVVAIGSFIGHKGHEELFNFTINKAKELGGDPYLFIGNAEGKDDPIPPAVKVQTWHKLYSEYADNISTVQQGGQLIQKIKHELINPLPNKPPRYDNIVIMVGEDRKDLNMPQALMKAVNKFQGYEHVKVSLGVTPRGTGISGTMLRNSLKNDPPEEALAVWSNAFDVKKLGTDWVKHLMNITKKGMGIQMPQKPQPAPVAERLFNALIKPNKEINESTSIDSALKIVVNDIGEPITAVYDKLKFMAKRYVHDHGELNRGWKMVEMGEGARWVQGMYNAQLKGALFALTKYNPKRTRDLQQFLAGREVKGEIELKRSFNNISNELPEILAKVGNYIESPELTKAARRWMQNKNEYENYIDSLGDDEDDYDTPTVKPEKSKLPGQQNAQADQIVNDILKRLPSKVAGDIRNAISRSPNKLQALQAELQNRGVKAPMAESLIEAARMSAAVKLQRAWEREQAKSTASRKRGEEYMNQIKQDVANKNKKPDETKDESIMGFLATPNHSVEKKSTTSSADMRKYFEKDKPSKPEKTERGDGGKNVQQVYRRSDEDQETPQQQQVRAAISKGMAKWDQNGLATYQSQPTNLHYFASSDWASGQLKGINSIDPDGTVVIELNDTTTAGLVKRLASLGGMPGVKTRQLKMTFDPAKMKNGVTRGDVAEDNLNELDMFAPRTVYFKMGDGNYIKADYRGSEGLTGHKANDNVTFTSMSWVPPNAARSLGLDKFLAKGSESEVVSDKQYAQSIIGTSSAGEGPLGDRTIDVVDFVNSKEDTVPSALKTQVMQWVEKNQSKLRAPAQGVAEGSSGAKYKVRSIGQDKKGEYYISPSTGEKVYKKAKVGDHEVPGSKEIKPRVAESEKTSQTDKSGQSSTSKEKKATPSQVEKNKEKWEPKQDKKGSNFDKVAESYNIEERSKYWAGKLNELEKSQFAGVKKNPLGAAGHLKATDDYAKAGDLVGEEKQKGVDGKACWKGYKRMGTKKKGGRTVDNCVKVSEAIEQKMANLIEVLKNK